MTDQELIRWARSHHPDDPNLIESGSDEETEASVAYIVETLLPESEQG